MEEKKKKLYEKWWFWITIVVAIAILANIGNTSNIQTSSTGLIAEQKELSQEELKKRKEQDEKEFKKECKTYTYEELARNPQKMIGKKVKITGEVVQNMEHGTENELRVDITKDKYGFYSDTIYITYIRNDNEDRVLEDDIITIWGIDRGEHSYTSILGSKVTLPYIEGKYVKINKK